MKPVQHVMLYLRAYLPLSEAPVNICLKAQEGKAHTPQYPGYLAPILTDCPNWSCCCYTLPTSSRSSIKPCILCVEFNVAACSSACSVTFTGSEWFSLRKSGSCSFCLEKNQKVSYFK